MLYKRIVPLLVIGLLLLPLAVARQHRRLHRRDKPQRRQLPPARLSLA